MKLEVRDYHFAPVGAVEQALKEMNKADGLNENTKRTLNNAYEKLLDFLTTEKDKKGNFLVSEQWGFYEIRVVRKVKDGEDDDEK